MCAVGMLCVLAGCGLLAPQEPSPSGGPSQPGKPSSGGDTTPPEAPRWAEGNPTLGNTSNLRLRLVAEPGSKLELFTGPICWGTVHRSAEADEAGLAEVEVSASAYSGTNTFVARAVDAAGNNSACSPPHTYVVDYIAPRVPSWASDNPTVGAGSALTLNASGDAEGSVRLFGTKDCTGEVLATATPDSAGKVAFALTVEADATHHYSLVAVDAAGNASACSKSHGYVRDSTAPEPPVLSGTEPAATGRTQSPVIKGSAEPGATVLLYSSARCEGGEASSKKANASGAFEFTLLVAENTTTHFSARARDALGHLSGCSSPLAYLHDNVEPAKPTFGGFIPSSPANHNAPVLTGRAEPHARVRIHPEGCWAGTLATVTADASGRFEVPLSVVDDASVDFGVDVEDAAGNVSSCLYTPVYREDSTAPALPVVTSTTASPGSSNSFVVSGKGEAGATVLLFATPDCQGTPADSDQLSSFADFGLRATVPSDVTTRLSLAQRDVAGNVSACLGPFTYTEDSTPPDVSGAVVADGSGEDVSSQTASDVVEANWTGFSDLHGIAAYEHAFTREGHCTGSLEVFPTRTTQPAMRRTGLTLSEGAYAHCVRAIDGTGNVSEWVRSNGFRVDLQPPVVSGTSPREGEGAADILAPIRLSFSEPVEAASVTAAQLTVEGSGGRIAGTVACEAATCTFTPSAPLPYGEPVRVTLTSARDLAGRTLAAPFTLSFTTRGLRWSPEPALVQTSRPGLTPAVALDGAGHALAVWVQGGGEGFRPFAARSSPFQGWSPPQALDTVNAGDAEHPAVALNAAGVGVAVWALRQGAQVDLYAAEYVPESGWSAPRLLETRVEPVSTPRVTVDGQGHALVVWRQSDGTAESLWAARLVAGVGWAAPLLLESEPGATSVPALAATASGQALVAWSQLDAGGTWRIRARRFTPDAGWTSAEQAASTSEGSVPGVALGANGSAVVIFRAPSGPEGSVGAWATRFVPGEGWSASASLLGAAFSGGEEPVVAMDRWGRALAAWSGSDGTQRTVLLQRFTPEGGWEPVALRTGVAGQPSVTVDGQGNFHLVWVANVEGTDRAMAARYPEGATALSATELLEPPHTGTSKRPRVASHGGSGAVVVWYRDNGTGFAGNLIYAKRYE